MSAKKKSTKKKAEPKVIEVEDQTVTVTVVSSIAGVDYSHKRGDVVEMNVLEAARFLAKGIVKVDDQPLHDHLADIAAGKIESN